MEQLSGGDMLIRFLADAGVAYIFGYPGGAALHIYDAIHRQDRVKHILVRHEQAATHMADGYARASGKPGVVLVTSGPGATNAITGIATAYMDSIPMVVISGQVESQLIGQDAFQETDMMGVSRPVVKHNFIVQKPQDIPLIMRQAFYLATSGRPGPVVVDIPKDITAPHQTFPYQYPEKVSLRTYNPVKKGHQGQIRKAVDLLLAAERPVIYSGGGVILGQAATELTKIARALNYPVTNTLMGLGGVPGDDPQFLGMLGMHGFYEANMTMHHADLVFAVGARFDDRVTNGVQHFCPQAKIIHIDIDPANIAKIIPVDVPIVGPVQSILADIWQLMKDRLHEVKRKVKLEAISTWWQQISVWRQQQGLLVQPRYAINKDILKPQQVVTALYEVTQGDAYVTSDVGQHQMFAAQYYPFSRPNRWINSGGLGTMGFGFPAAMGVNFADPDVPVVCVTGEGSIQMCIQELSTCKQYDIPVKIVNINNRSLGMVRQWQDMQYQGRHASSYMDSLPDFVQLVAAYGHIGIKVTEPAQLKPALEQALTQYANRLVFLDVYVDPTEHVYPMQIKGGAMKDMWLNKTERS